MRRVLLVLASAVLAMSLARMLLAATGGTGGFTQPHPPYDASWVRSGSNPLISPAVAWEETAVYEPTVLNIAAGDWRMWYGGGWANPGIGYATSTDGLSWSKSGSNPVLGQGGSGVTTALRNTVVQVGSGFRMYYADANPTGNIKVATSGDGIAWTVVGTALPNSAAGWATGFQNTSVVKWGGTWWMLVDGYTGSVFNLALATSTDGLTFTLGNSGNALTTLEVASGGTYGSPSLQRYGGVWHLWYLAVNGTGNLPTDIYHASSPDLITWTRSPSTPVLTHTGSTPEVDQVADPHVLIVDGTAYLYYAAMDNASEAGVVNVATAAAVP